MKLWKTVFFLVNILCKDVDKIKVENISLETVEKCNVYKIV